MLLPTNIVDILGTLYEVILINGMIDDGIEGSISVKDAEIHLDEGLDSPQLRAEILIHEIVHGYAFKLGDLSEDQVITLTSMILHFITNNKELAECIIDMASKKAEHED